MRTLCILSILILTYPSAAQQLPFDQERFEAVELVVGLIRPMEVDVASDGRVFFIELDGRLRVFRPTTGAVETLAELSVFNEQENGLIGLALDPNFANNHFIYLQYSPVDYPGQHVSRFTLDGNKLDLNSERILLKFEEQRIECCHHAGSLQFGPHGNLFIGTGDNTHPGGDSHGYAPIDERDGKHPWDAQKSAANTQHLSGKILRIKPTANGGYTIPAGNLFSDPQKGRPEIYVMGCRNPWRLNVDQKSGFVYWGEVGPDAHHDNERGPRGYDEINQARTAGNFGWPYFIADNQAYADVDFASGDIGDHYDVLAPQNHSPNNTGATVLPPAQKAFIYYPYSYTELFPELGEGGRTACAGPVYRFDQQRKSGTQFPREFDNTLFIFEWTRHWIKCVHLNDDGSIRSIKPFMPNRQFQRPIDMEFGSDGSLYVLEYGETWGVNKDAKLVRIDYVAGNRRPRAHAKATNNVGREPLQVQLSSAGTEDKDQDPLSYRWVVVKSSPDAKAASRTLLSTEANPTITFEYPGIYSVELTVSDDGGAESRATVPVIVGNEKPSIELREVGHFFKPGESISYEIIVNDTEDGTNDFDLADEQDLPEIDLDAPSRVSMNIRELSGPQDAASEDPGLKLMKTSDCFNCHDLVNPRVGPPLTAISKKYRDDPHAIQASVKRVINGSTGVWGKVPMIPHKQHTEQDVHVMVNWIFGLRENAGMRVMRGFVGDVVTDHEHHGDLILEASYTDRGVGTIPPVTSTLSRRLRNRRCEAEFAIQINGPTKMQSETASNGQFLGSINHGHFIRFDDVSMDTVRAMTFRVASDGSTGTVEIRLDRVDGPVITQVDVPQTGGWEIWRDLRADVVPCKGTHDLFVVFANDEKRQALMNLDSIFFH